MRVLTFERIDAVPADLWDATAPPEFTFTRAFLRAMESSGVEQARYRYLLLFDGEEIAGLAVLSAFTLRLDLLAGQGWMRLLRRLPGGLLDLPIICCGVPASCGQRHFHVRREALLPAAVEAVHEAMTTWARQEMRRFLFWKEWNPGDAPYRAILDAGYIAAPTLPDHRVRLGAAGGGSSSFLGALRSAYRRKFRTAAALLRGPGPQWRHGPLVLEEIPFRPERASAFHHGYESVMARTKVRLERYPAAFFEALASSGLDLRLLRLSHDGHRESLTALLVAEKEVLTFMLVAKDRAHYHEGLYTTLLQCIVLLGERYGVAEVRLGQTSAWSKSSIGAGQWRLETLLRATSPWRQWILERAVRAFFPETVPTQFHVFRAAR